MKNIQPKKDLYQQVTDSILSCLEKGNLPWLRPWQNVTHGFGLLPCNGETGRPYAGINLLLLWKTAYECGFKQRKWVMFKGAENLGGSVRKGERGTLIIYYKPSTPKKDGSGDIILDENGEPEMSIPVYRGHYVFNIEQCDGLEKHFETIDKTDESVKFEVNPKILALPQVIGVKLRHLPQNKAFYMPATDSITLPEVNQFKTLHGYYNTLMHEMGHSTGHKKRLNRDGIVKWSRYGTRRYAFEELIAELTSAFTCAHLGIFNDYDQTAIYLDSWIQVLRNDKTAILVASREARKATEYLLNAYTQIEDEDNDEIVSSQQLESNEIVVAA